MLPLCLAPPASLNKDLCSQLQASVVVDGIAANNILLSVYVSIRDSLL